MRRSERRWQGAGLGSLLAACVGLATACGSGQLGEPQGMVGPTGSGGGSSAGQGGGGGGPGAGVGGGGGSTSTGTGGGSTGVGGSPVDQPCSPNDPLAQRLIRLDYNQLATTITSLLGANALANVTLFGNTGDPKQRLFQPLASEGDSFDPQAQMLSATVNMVEGALNTNFGTVAQLATLTGCANPITDACALNWLTTNFAPRAYKRPLTSAETMAISALYTNTLKTTNGSASDEALRFGIEGIMITPQGLYRSELGGTAQNGQTTLTPYELASELSYFLTNGPPDATLTSAAASGKLGTAAGVGSEVDRIMKLPATIENLNVAAEAYYELGHLTTAYTVKDPGLFPEWTDMLAASMFGETDKFLRTTLWQGKLTDLLTSKTTFVDSTMAKLYGITYPGAAGGTAFMQVTLPATQRMGILTQASIMTLKSRSNTTSVVARGLYVLGNVLCLPPPPPPPTATQDPDTAAKIAAQAMDTTATERDKAHFRDTTLPCMNCHLNFDPYGLAFESFDPLGRYRSTYAAMMNEAIDTSVTLPPTAGGAMVKDAIGLEQAVADNGIFTRCMATNFMRYARAQAQSTLNSTDCSVNDVRTTFNAGTDQSFGGLVRAIALSKDLSVRGVQ